MKKFIYKRETNHILLSDASGQIKIEPEGKSYVVGFAIENLSTSTGVLNFGLNESPKIPLQIGDSRSYGGIEFDNCPLVFTGEIQYRYVSGAPTTVSGLLVITRMVPYPIDCVEVQE